MDVGRSDLSEGGQRSGWGHRLVVVGDLLGLLWVPAVLIAVIVLVVRAVV